MTKEICHKCEKKIDTTLHRVEVIKTGEVFCSSDCYWEWKDADG